MVNKKTAAGCVLVALLLLSFVSGCSRASPSPTELTGDILLENLISAYQKMHTYRFDINGGVSFSGESYLFPEDTGSSYRRSAIVDNDNKISKFDIVVSVPSIGEVQAVGDIKVTIYFTDAWIYMGTNIQSMPDRWAKSVPPEGYWEKTDIIKAQIELLKASEISVTGEEVIDGTDCYIVRVEPGKKAIWEAMSQQMPLDEQIIDTTDPETMVDEVSATYWIIKNSFLPKKEHIRLVAEISQDALGMPDNEDTGIQLTMEMTTVFSDYNLPVSIEIPPEAENAPVMEGTP